MSSPFLQVFNKECRQLTKYVTATEDAVSNKTGLDVNICNPEDLGGSEPCIQTIAAQTLTASTVATRIQLDAVARTYIKITNMDEFYPVFYTQSSGGAGDVILPCSVITLCMNTTTNNELFFTTESGEARVVLSQSDS